MPDAPLTETSFIVLGLLDLHEPATPYELKQFAQVSVFNVWPVPHTQLYAECARLAEAGLLTESREESGRRRRFYKLTARGRKALERWRGEATDQMFEGRDLAALKLFFGADPAALAEAQLEVHRARLKELETNVTYPALASGIRLTMELGINQERALIRFWSRLAGGDSPDSSRRANSSAPMPKYWRALSSANCSHSSSESWRTCGSCSPAPGAPGTPARIPRWDLNMVVSMA